MLPWRRASDHKLTKQSLSPRAKLVLSIPWGKHWLSIPCRTINQRSVVFALKSCVHPVLHSFARLVCLFISVRTYSGYQQNLQNKNKLNSKALYCTASNYLFFLVKISCVFIRHFLGTGRAIILPLLLFHTIYLEGTRKSSSVLTLP